MVEDVKKVKVIKTLLCHGGPVGGYEVGAIFEAPFPAGISRELEADFEKISAGKGALEIIGEEKQQPVKEWKKKS
ncbi:MAG: hypothetical protein WA151_02195 [Desulfatirhabdiaceae bacterium]